MDELASANKGSLLRSARGYIIVLLGILVVFVIGWYVVRGVTKWSSRIAEERARSTIGDGDFCGGIMNLQCPTGYKCKLDGNYPDAGGKCVRR